MFVLGTNFYPRPLRGGRQPSGYGRVEPSEFLSTPSARRATSDLHPADYNPRFLSTPSARRATLHGREQHHRRRISIHALCEEGDLLDPFRVAPAHKFLSTPSARRATRVRGGGDRNEAISIHALCEEGDKLPRLHTAGRGLFLSTPSARRATPCSMRTQRAE